MRFEKKVWFKLRRFWAQVKRAAGAAGQWALALLMALWAVSSGLARAVWERAKQGWWRLRYWRTRRKIEDEAEKALRQEMTGSAGGEEPGERAPEDVAERARLETEKAARQASENAPLGSLSPRQARQVLAQTDLDDLGEVLDPDTPGSRVVSDPFSVDLPEPKGREMQDRHTSSIITPYQDGEDNLLKQATDSVSITREERQMADARRGRMVNFESAAGTIGAAEDVGLEGLSLQDSEDLTLQEVMEQADASVQAAEDIAPEPRGTRVRETDLTATGYWETNPNAAEEIQEANQFPMVNSQIRQTIIHLLTSRPKISGPARYADVVRRWFEVEMEYASGFRLGIYRFVSDLANQMLRYGTATVFKQRTSSASRRTYQDPVTGGTRNPVWGYRVPDNSTVQVFVDQQARPRKVRQDPTVFGGTADPTSYAMRDVFFAHLPFRNTQLYFWTPSLVTPVLYAVKVLEELHDTVERHSLNIVDIPSYAKVGSKDYLDGQVTPSMLDEVSTTLGQLQPDELAVFPHYVDLERHESDEYIEQLLSAGSYWERIVRRGIGQTKISDGESLGASRNAADTFIERGMRFAQALVPEIQKAARWLFIDRVLEEPGVSLDDLESHDDMPTLEFEDINHTQQQARESHITFLWQNDLITHDEARTLLGEDPDDERDGSYFSDLQSEMNSDDQAESRTRPGGEPKPKRRADGT